MQKSNWKKYTLGQVSIDVSYGYTASANSIPIGPKFLRITDIIPYFINWNNVPYCTINNNLISKYKLKRGDVVIARTGATTGYNAVIDADINSVFASFLIRFRLNQNIVFSKFIKYILKSDFYKDFIANHIGGSAQPGINAKTLSLFPINLPPIEEQKRIADILGAFDDKIELLQKQNTTLENMAKALFKSWFVDFDVVHAKQQGQPKAAVMQQYHLTEELYNLFPSSFEPSSLGTIPTGWQVKPLSQIATFLNGLALQKYSTNNKINFLPVIKIAELRNGLSASSDKASCDIPAEYIVFNGDILFSWSGSLMVKIWSGPKGALNQHLFKVSSLDYPKWFYYMWIKEYLPFFQEIAADKATTMGHIQRKHLDQALVCIPQNLNIYTRYFAKLIDKQILNNKQIQTLTEMRDALLPRLISGKIRV